MSKATAIVAVGAVCNLGADLFLQQSGTEGNDDYLANLLVQKGAIHFFEMGFACLHGSVRRAALKGINQLALDCIQKASSQQQAKELHALHEKIVALNASNAVVSYECPDLMDLSDWLEGAALSQLEAAIEPLPHLSSPQAGSQGSPYRSSDGIGFISNLEEIDELNAQSENLFGKPNSASATHS